jgi:hypothetical protein
MQELFDPARHERIGVARWSESEARQAVELIAAAAEAEFDEREGSWLLHPQDDPPLPGARSLNLYWGATGVVWALRHLQDQGAITLKRDYTSWIERYPDLVRQEAAAEAHGSASYLFGESAALLLAWTTTGRSEFADRLHAAVQGNLHNPAREPLWGNAGTVLAAIRMAEATGEQRWSDLVQQATLALVNDMSLDPETGTWIWEQDLYGSRSRYLGAGHGLAGNAYAALRGAAHADAADVRMIEQRVFDTLSATSLRATLEAPEGQINLINWHVLVDKERVATWLAKGGRPLVQDCHGAPGIVCRLSGVPRGEAWDELLSGAGELSWHAGPLVKGPSLCHGTAGSAMACLKLWGRFSEAQWLERARRLALHAAAQVEQARARHRRGRHSLWTGDLGVACVLWSCVVGNDAFPTLDYF